VAADDSSSLLGLALGALRDAAALTEAYVSDYLSSLRRMAFRLLLLCAAPLPVLALLLLFGSWGQGVLGAYLIYVAILGGLLCLFAFPLLLAASTLVRHTNLKDEINAVVVPLATIGFWVVALAAYLFMIPGRPNPVTLLLAVLMALALALASVAGAFSLPTRAFAGKLAAVLLVLFLSMLFPNITRVLLRLKPAGEEMLVRGLGQYPDAIEVASVADLPCFDVATGEAKVWYHRNTDGTYALFTNPGYDKLSGEELTRVSSAQECAEIQASVRTIQETAGRKAEALNAERRTEAAERQLREATATRAEELALQEAHRRSYLERYIAMAAIQNRPESREVAILLIDEAGRLDSVLAQGISDLLDQRAWNPTVALFTSAVASDSGLFDDLFQGRKSRIDDLELRTHVDYILAGRETLEYSRNPQLADLFSAHLTLELHRVPVKEGGIERVTKFSVVGAGFSEDSSRLAAFKKMLKLLKPEL